MKKSISAALISALILLTPGLDAYAAAVEVFGPKIGQNAAGRAPVGPNLISLSQPGVTLAPAMMTPGLSPDTLLSVSPEVQPENAAPAAAELLTQQEALALPADKIAALPQGQARSFGYSVFDRILGIKARAAASSQDTAFLGQESSRPSPLSPVSFRESASVKPSVPNPDANKPQGSKAAGLVKTVLRMAAAGGAVVGLNLLAAAALPAVFGFVPVAAVWAVTSGVFLLPAALYARYRLSLRDSPRLAKVKWVLDLGIGAYLGALTIAAPSVGAIFSPIVLGSVAAVGAGAALSHSGGKGVDLALSYGALAGTPLILAAAAAGAIGFGPALGMLALPVMTTLSFFLGRIISAAETGQPFTVPGSLQAIRFPNYPWVMMGVVFALMTGFGAVYANYAFMSWMFLGDRDKFDAPKGAPGRAWKLVLNKLLRFNTLYFGLLAFVAGSFAFTGVLSPLTFLVIAFAPERAAFLTEKLLGKLLPQSEPAPSTAAAPPVETSEQKTGKRPEFHYWLKTGLLLATMLGLGFFGGAYIFGIASFLKNLGIAALMAGIPLIFAKKLIKAVMKAQPANAQDDPEFFAIMSELRDDINAERAAKGKKPIAVPEMVRVPNPLPNAFATGRDPNHAMVGITDGIREMLLVPGNVRQSLIALISATDPASPSFRIFRAGVAGSLKGVSDAATAADLTAALGAASDAELKALGVRMLRGVLGHEFSHVMDRHMLTGSIAGALSSAVAFASYGILWTLGQIKVIVKQMLGMETKAANQGTQEFVEPITAATAAVKGAPLVIKLFAALWGPTILSLTQMAASRNNEGQADEDGAYRTKDPAALALALGMLMSYRPKKSVLFEIFNLPRLAAVAPYFTVNLLEQADRAGMVGEFDGVTRAVVGKKDDFFFNLFITHPNTTLRIEKLEKIWAGMQN